MSLPDLTAFWRYDAFPYVLHGDVIDIGPDGYVKTLQYGSMRFKPIAMLPTASVAPVINELEHLRGQYREELRQLHQRMDKSAAEVAPFMADLIRARK